MRRRILELAPAGRAKLSGKLHDWPELGFAAFRAEVKARFRAILLEERGECEAWLAERRGEAKDHSEKIERAKAEIDRVVYALFDLTPGRSCG